MTEKPFESKATACRWVAIVSAIAGLIALILAALGGGMILAVESLLVRHLPDPLPYPLGTWVYPLYIAGIGMSMAALWYPKTMGVGMALLGACMFFFGGPVARIYGMLMMVSGIVILWLSVSVRNARMMRS